MVPEPTGQGAQAGEEARRNAAQGETGRRSVPGICPTTAAATTAAATTSSSLRPAAAHATHGRPATPQLGQQSSNILVHAHGIRRPDGHQARLRARLNFVGFFHELKREIRIAELTPPCTDKTLWLDRKKKKRGVGFFLAFGFGNSRIQRAPKKKSFEI